MILNFSKLSKYLLYYVRYTDQISADPSFVLEIRHLIRHSSAKLLNRLAGVDLHALFTQDLFPLLLAHVERICRIANTIFAEENNAKELMHAVGKIKIE